MHDSHPELHTHSIHQLKQVALQLNSAHAATCQLQTANSPHTDSASERCLCCCVNAHRVGGRCRWRWLLRTRLLCHTFRLTRCAAHDTSLTITCSQQAAQGAVMLNDKYNSTVYAIINMRNAAEDRLQTGSTTNAWHQRYKNRHLTMQMEAVA
jgi:hypothetical protein